MFIFVRDRNSKQLSHIALVSHGKYARLKVILEEKFPILINACILSSTCITGASWDFLEKMKDKLGGTIMICDMQ